MRTLPPTGTVEIAPSILSADFSRLSVHIAEVEPAVQILHLDVMDGHFVPNISFGPGLVKKIRPHSHLFFDTHLMISDPDKYAPEFVQAGSDLITFHLEAVKNPQATIALLRQLRTGVGVSIKPKTPVAALEPIIADVDMVLLMTVEPGFGGQSFIPESIDRCKQLKKMLRSDQRLQVDGGIDTTTAPEIAAAGADTLVAGNAVFAQSNPAGAAQAIQQAVRAVFF